MRIDSRKFSIVNLIAYVLFLLPLGRLDLFKENYSTLSLDTRGYFYLLFLGIVIGLLLAYETYHINNKEMATGMFLSLFLGTVIPHHIPYDLQGNLHLLFAYLGFAGIMSITFMNLIRYNNQYLINMYFLSLFSLAFLYMHYGMVNTLMEVIIMTLNLFVNYLLYKKKCL